MMRLLKDFDDPRKQARRLDLTAFLTVQLLIIGGLLIVYATVSFEVAVLVALSVIILQTTLS